MDRQPDRVGVLLDRRLDDLLGGLVQPGVDDLHPRVAERAGDDLDARSWPSRPGFAITTRIVVGAVSACDVVPSDGCALGARA